MTTDELQKLEGVLFQNRDKIRSISNPTLIIHGEMDEIIYIQEGKELFQDSGASDKSILIIPGSRHNDLLFNGKTQYFSILGDFVNKYS
jgi:esterase/lipase